MIDKKYFMLCDSIREEELNILNGNYKANIKFDGERIIAVKQGDKVFLFNRRGREKSHIYPEIARNLKRADKDFILDGEVITKDGLFNSLQHRSNLSDREKIKSAEKDYPIKFMVFDILNVGKDLRFKPLKERLEYWGEIKFKLIKPINKGDNFNVVLCEYGAIKDLLEYSKERDYEGIVIKNMESIYQHKRSRDWLKLKFFKETELRVVRYTKNNAGIRVEDEEKNALQVSGEQHRAVKQAIDKKGYCDITIQYLQKTKEGRLRFPSYRGLKC